MPSYIVRNGKLQERQKDFNVPNYRIVPYKSSINPTHNDYLTNTMDQLQKQIQKINEDYRNLAQTMWKILSQIDRVCYDPQVMFMGLKCEQIYQRICLVRSINANEPEQQSLRLSAIMKIDDTNPIYAIQQQESSPYRSKLREEIKQDSLYEIQEQQQCVSTSSHRQNRRNSEGIEKNLIKEKAPTPNSIKGTRRLSLESITGQKRQGRRSSFLLREKISLAFHEQKQLRQLLEEELQKITQQLDEKNQCLKWATDELQVRNELIQKLKETIWQRDEALEIQQQKSKARQSLINLKPYEQLVDEKDKQIGMLINSLIERTQSTQDDVQFLRNSVRACGLKKQIVEGETRQQEYDRKIDQSIYLDELQKSIRNQSFDQVAKSSELNLSQLKLSCQRQTLQCSALKPKKMNFDSPENITYLTKEHFLQAEKRSENFVMPNVKMTQSLKADNMNKSLRQSP